MGKKIAARATTPREKALAVFRWIRDEVTTVPYRPGWLNSWEVTGIHSHGGVWVGEREADQVLRKREADIAEKSLLLKVMLEGAKLEPELAWANPRDHGKIDREIPNPRQFSRILVSLDIDGELIFLDPSDRGLAFGQLRPELQGLPCLVLTKKNQQWHETPAIPATDSIRHAQVELAVDKDGRISGRGSLELTGNHALVRIGLQETPDQAENTWTAWIREAFSDLEVINVTVTEAIPKALMRIQWEVAQKPGPLPGGKAGFSLSPPLTVTHNPFTLAPTERITPVQLEFPGVEKLDLVFTWSAGWQFSGVPPSNSVENSAGSLNVDHYYSPESRKIEIRRELTIRKNLFADPASYQDLSQLFEAAAENGTQHLSVIRADMMAYRNDLFP